MNGPLVSIVLPTHNGLRYLGDAISSCLNQSHHNLELIVVNDASTDATARLLADIDDPRLIVVHNRANLGLPRSLNVGFARARGDLLTWTSDDNLYEPQALAVMIDRLQSHPDLGLVYADYVHIDEAGQLGQQVRVQPPEILQQRNVVGACFLYRRHVGQAVGDYDHHMRLAEDYDYWVRIQQRFPIARIPQCLYRYRFHKQALTCRRTFEASAAVLQVRRRHFLADLSTSEWRQRIFIDCLNRTLTAIKQRRFRDLLRGWCRIGFGPWLNLSNLAYLFRSLAYSAMGKR